jgi:hypothetical protein
MKTRYTAALSMLAGVAVGALAIQGLHAQAKPPVYFIVENEISDVKSYLKEYAVHARDMIKTNGGRYLAAGDATTYVGEPPKIPGGHIRVRRPPANTNMAKLP